MNIWIGLKGRKLNSQEYLKLLIGVKERMSRGEMVWQQS